MDKSRLLGLLLITVVFLLWMQNLSKKQLAKQGQWKADSIAALEKSDPGPKSIKSVSPQKIAPEIQSESTPDSAMVSGNTLKPALEEKRIKIETNHYELLFSSKGAGLISARVKALRSLANEGSPEIFSDSIQSVLGLQIGTLDLTQTLWVADSAMPNNLKLNKGKHSVIFRTEPVPGQIITRTFVIYADSQKIDHQIDLPASFENNFNLFWSQGMRETEPVPEGKGWGLTYGYFSEIIFSTGAIVERATSKKSVSYNEKSGNLRWVGLRRKYVAALVNFHRNTDYTLKAEPLIKENKNGDNMHTYGLQLVGQDYRKGDLDFSFYILPLLHENLVAYNEGYEKILFSGWEFLNADVWYVKLCGMVLNLLNWFYSYVPNYGIAIILLTLLVRLVLLPLTVSQTKSMSKLQAHQPAIKEIREKYKGNPQKVNKEMMAYYREQGVNPMAPMLGCLPMFFQFPVFISLFHVLGRAVELRETPFLLWISDLSRPDVLIEAVKIPFLFPMGITILPVVMALTMFFQTKMTITDPNQKAMIYIMPIMMFFISSSFPSGLVLYWSISNIFTIGQTMIFKKKTVPVAISVSKKGNSPQFKKRKAKK